MAKLNRDNKHTKISIRRKRKISFGSVFSFLSMLASAAILLKLYNII